LDDAGARGESDGTEHDYSGGVIGVAPVASRVALLGDGLRSRNRVLWTIVRRIGMSLPILLLAPYLSFLLAKWALAAVQPGSFGPPPEADQTSYFSWLGHALRGDLGISASSQDSIARRLAYEAPVTASLVVGTLLVSAVVGGALGVVSAVRGGWLGRVLDAFSVTGFALPVFWLGPVIVGWFAVDLHWFPAIFLLAPDTAAGWVQVMVLPVVALAFGGIAAVAKQTREAMLDALGSEYIRMARARGVSPQSIVLRHALRPASLKVITVLGVLASGFLAGSVFVEYVFALPGLGLQLLDSAKNHDLPQVEAITLFFTMIIVAVNLLIDLAYVWLNPRVKPS
jgi:peptide/nickel transport system permease protein